MRSIKIVHILLSVFLILTILLLSKGMVSAQYPFYNPFYYTGSYFTPFSYPFFPAYNPVFPAYNPVFPAYNPTSVLPFYNPININPTPVPTAAFTAPAIA